MNIKKLLIGSCLLIGLNTVKAQVLFESSSSNEVNSIQGGATWSTDESGGFVYDNNGTTSTQRAMLYSTEAFQSEDGFKLTVEYTAESIEDLAAHNFSFGLISDDTDLSTYTGINPFRADSSVYSIGANLTTNGLATARGLNYTNGNESVTLDEAGTRIQYATDVSTKVTLEIGIGGYWSYRINDVYEASGVLLEGFDLSKNYHIAVYGQDDNGGEKSIQSILLEKRYAAGDRAKGLRGTWSSGMAVKLMDAVKDLKTLDGLGVGFTDGAVLSAQHYAPHKLLESISDTIDIVPTWGDLSLDEPEYDPYLEDVLKVKAAGFKVKAYTNSENFVGPNSEELEVFVQRWKTYCDTSTEVQAFINSQPFHTGIWNRTTEQYEDATATYPDRKYMFCYAEFVLKDYSLRYGEHFASWIFDDGGTMKEQGDNQTSGIIEEQRIYQAFANAVHAGNPEIPVAFNNSRSNINYASYPFAHAVRFDDFTFGHAFGGNNNHGEKVNGNQFNLNYQHITRMTETNGYVHDGGNWDWDDNIVGNFHSKISTTAWKFGPAQAWEQDDFNQWNLEAMQAGGAMTWDGSFNRTYTFVYDWVVPLLKGLDDHLCQYQSPGAPNWARAYTILPSASYGVFFTDTLYEDVDFWDPEEDNITSLVAVDAPYWLSINEDPNNPGHWILSGLPNETTDVVYEFELQATDANGETGTRKVELDVKGGTSPITDPKDGSPVWVSDVIDFEVNTHSNFSYLLTRGIDFEDFDNDELTIQKVSGASWISLDEFAPNIWKLSGTSTCSGIDQVELTLSDGKQSVNTIIEFNVTNAQFLDMQMTSVNGGATWNTPDAQTTELVYNNRKQNYNYSALLYSEQSYQSNEGFKLKVNYTTGSIDGILGHHFSFGLISEETDLANYTGMNPFAVETNVYSLGVNITAHGSRGLNFTDGTSLKPLDVAGDNVQFPINESSEVIIEIAPNGVWSYSINGVEEATGTINEGFDLNKSYHVAIYGQDDDGGGKTIQNIALETCFEPPIITNTTTLEESTSSVYPNPTSGLIQFSSETDYQITNILGSVIASGTGNSVNISGQATGVYSITVVEGNKTATYKIIKK